MVKGSDENFTEPDDSRDVDPLAARRHGYAGDQHRRGTRTSQQIQADINRTRAELDETVDELQDRLDPQVIVRQAFDVVRTSASGVIDSVVQIVKANPIPTALICVGLVWLIAKQASGGSRSSVLRDMADDDEIDSLAECAQPASFARPEVF